MNVKRIDLNLLVYLNTLLKEWPYLGQRRNLACHSTAMQRLRRLRDLLGDPILVRTSSGIGAY